MVEGILMQLNALFQPLSRRRQGSRRRRDAILLLHLQQVRAKGRKIG
jgi:hypothetical protein